MKNDKQATAWPAQPRAPKRAPNVLLVLTDDVGFGACSTFGGPIPTPVLDQLAANGLRFTRFHTTAMCSPTRASLLTGRNPHNVQMGRLATYPSGVDGYTAEIPHSAGTIADALRSNGYSTAMFGKSHLTPEWEMSSVGPFDHWPTGLGFEYFYGFLGHDTNQWAPTLVENTTFIDPPYHSPHFDETLADRAISWIAQQRATAPERPFFAYYAPGTAHTPHHAPDSWLQKFRGQFDIGWDALRDQTFQRQKEQGVVPQDTQLTQRPGDLPSWDSLGESTKKVGARFMEAYAASLAHCDYQVGRVIDSIRILGELDNTLVIFIQGDNGGSAEGGLHGLFVSMSRQNAFEEDPDYVLSRIDEIGGPQAYNHFPAGWGWAMNTPFQYFKQVASHFGGTRNGMVVHWPDGIKEAGGIRTQFHHVSDVMPTILEAVGISHPELVGGVRQDPIDGTSMLYAFESGQVEGTKNVQVFECRENFGVYKDGWFAGSTPENMPYVHSMFQKPVSAPENRSWELYDVRSDFSQAHNLAGTQGAVLADLQETFWNYAKTNRILPLHPPSKFREGKPTLGANRKVFTYHGAMSSRIFDDAAPPTVGRAFAISAELELCEGQGNGVIASHGGRFGGYALYLDERHVVFHYNAIAPRHYEVRAGQPLSAGRHVVDVRFKPDRTAPGSGGLLTIALDGEPVAEGRLEHTLRTFMNSDGMHIGRDAITPVCDGYALELSSFDGLLHKTVFTVE